ncbi:MAG: TlpA family protein disulfide reductase [Neomegalonema sp.]|nr:TlpA family protein disulfide reductase [Neomegalonema sp.]
MHRLLLAALLLFPGLGHAYEPDMSTRFGQRIEIASPPIEPYGLPILLGDGAETNLPAQKGQVSVLVFWATWCAVCKLEMPQIEALAGTIDGVQFLPISLDSGEDARAKVAQYYARSGFEKLPVAIDLGRMNFAALGGRGTPTSYVLDKAGQVVARVQGPGDWGSDEARRFLAELVAQ